VRTSILPSKARGLTRPDERVVPPPRCPLPRRKADAVKDQTNALTRPRPLYFVFPLHSFSSTRMAPSSIGSSRQHTCPAADARSAARLPACESRAQRNLAHKDHRDVATRAALVSRWRTVSSRLQLPRLSKISPTLKRPFYRFVRRGFALPPPSSLADTPLPSSARVRSRRRRGRDWNPH
jgi:hypothetical protein